MFSDKLQEYKIELCRTRLIINNMRALDVPVHDFYNKLENLNVPEEKRLFGVQSRVDYQSSIKSLKELQKELYKYEFIYKVKASVNCLNTFMSGNLTSADVEKCADEIITSLNVIKHMDVFLISQFDNVFSEFYECVYNVIKLEFIYKDKSKVLDYILNDKTHIAQINELIRKDVSKLFKVLNDVPNFKELRLVLSEIDNFGMESNYVCEQAIRALVICTDYDKIRLLTKEKVNGLFLQLQDNLNQISVNINSNEERINEYKDKKKDLLTAYKRIKKRVISFVLSGVTIGGIYSSIVILTKDYNNFTKYNTTCVEYSSASPLDPIERTEYLEEIENGYQVLMVQDVPNKFFVQREVYDVTEYFTPLRKFDYSFQINTDKLSDKLISSERVDFVDIDDKLNMDKYKYIVMSQDKSDSITEFNKEEYYSTNIVSLICYLVTMLIYVIVFGMPLKGLKDYKLMKKDINSDKQYVDKTLGDIFLLLESNEKLKSEFMDVYNKHKDMLDEEIVQKINSLFSDNNELKLKSDNLK